MNNLTKINASAHEYIKRYQHLRIFDQYVNTPYYINNPGMFVFTKMLAGLELSDEHKKKFFDTYKNREVPFGWYRGKGTPEQLEEAVLKISEQVGIGLSNATSYGIEEFMKLYGLGVDCSGFVFNTLSHAFTQSNLEKEFMASLGWGNPDKQGVNYAGAFVFASGEISVISPAEIRPLDLVLIKESREYSHIGLIVEDERKLYLAQSNLDSIPNGVSLSEVEIQDSAPYFHFKPQIATDWNTYIERGVLEFRRFNFLG